jgi:hypothetical protein
VRLKSSDPPTPLASPSAIRPDLAPFVRGDGSGMIEPEEGERGIGANPKGLRRLGRLGGV